MQVVLAVLDDVRWRGSPVTGDRPRALLRALVEAGAHGASVDTLVREIWGDSPPAHPRKALQVLVSRVRAATEPRVIAPAPAGYRIGLERAEVDVTAAADLSRRAADQLAAGAAADALATAAAARTLGDDPALRRTAALAHARLGDHTAALAALRAVLDTDPWDEEVVAALLRAEAAVHGPAAALERYERYRAAAVDRLGTDPGPAVQAAHRALLAADRPIRVGLPHTATELVGRETDVAAVGALIAAGRLVSIVGTGGLGKTRLAREVAHRAPAGAVYFVELAPVTAPDQVLAAVAAALGIRDRLADRPGGAAVAPAEARTQIVRRLQYTPTLLVLDNCEHVPGPVTDLVAGLLAAVADLQVLTTSRSPLGLAEEQVYPLDPLAAGPAADLFTRRARARRTGVVLDPGEVAALVDLLEGSPLAIELAAAQVRVLSIRQITAAMTDRFALLRADDRSAPARHRTLAAVIDWSFRLLTTPTADALIALAVFSDGFTAAHARTLLAAAQVPGAESGPVPAPVTELVDQSLLTVEEDEAAVRYRMLQTVREFAARRGADRGRTELLRAAKAAWARRLCRAAAPDLLGPGQPAALAAVRAAEADLLEVLGRACRSGDAPTAVEVLAAVGPYWFLTGRRIRVLGLIDPVEEALAGWVPSGEEAAAARFPLSMLGVLGAMGPLHDRLAETGRILRLLAPGGESPFARALNRVARTLLAPGPTDQGPRLAQLTEDPERLVAMLAGILLAGVQENAGDPRGALDTAAAALARVRAPDGPWPRTFLQVLIAQLHGQLGAFADAAVHAAAAEPELRAIGADDDAAQCQVILAVAALDRADLGGAEAALTAATGLRSREDSPAEWAAALVGAEIALARGDRARAHRLLDRALTRDHTDHGAPAFDSADWSPWILLGEAAALVLSASADPGSGSASDAAALAHRLHGRLTRALQPQRTRHDYPVLGTALFALGVWRLRGPGPAAQAPADTDPDPAVAYGAELVGLAEAFAYNRFLPALALERATALLGPDGDRVRARTRSELSGRPGPVLLARAATAVADQRSRW